MKKVLVVGATGLTGSAIARGLLRNHAEVSALVRDPSATNAKELQTAGASLLPGDLTRPETLSAACAGHDVVVCTATSMPTGANDGLRKVDLEGALALIDAAERAAVRRFVYISFSANIRYESPLGTAKRACEQRLLDSAMAVEILRPCYFMEVWLGPHLGVDIAGGKARVYGTGTAKGNYVSLRDVAAFAVAAAVREDPGKHIVEIGGPDALSQLDAIAQLEQLASKTVAREHLPREAIEAQYRAASDPLQKTFAALMLAYADGDPIPDAVANAKTYGVRLTPLREAMGSAGATA